MRKMSASYSRIEELERNAIAASSAYAPYEYGHANFRNHTQVKGFRSLFHSQLLRKVFTRTILLGLAIFAVLFAYQTGSSSIRCHRPIVDIHTLTETDLEFSFAEREAGSLEPMMEFGPRNVPLQRKLGLIAIAAGHKSKERVDKLVKLAGFENFHFFLWHWDNSTWNEFDWYANVTSVRQLKQTKYWFAKRFLSPHIVQNYDYVFVWDDDFGLSPEFDPAKFVMTMKNYNIHFAQPAISSGEHFGVTKVVNTPGVIGRYVNFVEMMFPVISSAAWSTCAWRAIPYDGRAYWGIDNLWYPMCGAQGFCRVAILDKFPVAHMDTRNLGGWAFSMTKELVHYRRMFTTECERVAESTSQATAATKKMAGNGQASGSSSGRSIKRYPKAVRDFCRLWLAGYFTTSIDFFITFNNITPEEQLNDRCPMESDFPGTRNKKYYEGLEVSAHHHGSL